MSSLARRSLRTTAAAAGIAALGVGFAGHAFAAPEAPALPGTDTLTAPEVPDATGGTEMVEGLMAAPETGEAGLPGLFVFDFQLPKVNMASLPPIAGNDTVAEVDQLQMERFGSPNVNPEALSDQPANGEDAASGLDSLGLPMVPLAGPNVVGAPAEPAAPVLPAAPAAPGTDLLDNVGSGTNKVGTPGSDPESLTDTNRVGALSAMDTAALFADMIENSMTGTAAANG